MRGVNAESNGGVSGESNGRVSGESNGALERPESKLSKFLCPSKSKSKNKRKSKSKSGATVMHEWDI